MLDCKTVDEFVAFRERGGCVFILVIWLWRGGLFTERRSALRGVHLAPGSMVKCSVQWSRSGV